MTHISEKISNIKSENEYNDINKNVSIDRLA